MFEEVGIIFEFVTVLGLGNNHAATQNNENVEKVLVKV